MNLAIVKRNNCVASDELGYENDQNVCFDRAI